jgi:ribonuclease R
VTGRPGDPGARRGAVVAVLEKRGRFFLATPFFEPGRRLTVQRDGGARAGDLVALRLGRGQPRVERVLGRPEVARDVIHALMVDRGVRRGFDPAVEHEAGAAARRIRRRDLRALPTFTVDPATARDYDDAISAQELDAGRWRLWVHIADVAAHVAVGSRVDREAYRRATSVYVPGGAEPMLPLALSTGACSLLPGQERAAVTAEMEMEGASVTRAAFYRSTIRSDERLDYDWVDRVFGGGERARDPWAAPLAAARAAAAALADARTDRGALTVESAEPEFSFDAEGNVVGARQVAQSESHLLVEHLMIAANEQVAALLEQRRVPTLYRVHEQPEPQSVRRLADQLASLDVPTPPVPEQMSPRQAGEVVGEVSSMVAAHVRRVGRGGLALTSLVLRALRQARYSPRNLGHAGLRSPRYCHFTSPIRRYPDLVCHRGLLSAVGAGEEAPRAEGLEEAGEWTSSRERVAMEIERDADAVAACFLLERELFEVGWDHAFEGEVVGLALAGAFIRFGEAHEGLLAVRRMRGDWWELNDLGTVLHGTRSGGALRLGDPVSVRVLRIDAPRGRVDLLSA